ENIGYVDADREASGAVDLQPAGELADEDAPAELIIPVADGVEDCLADGAVTERGGVEDVRPGLVRLRVVPGVDELPEPFIKPEEAFAKLFPGLGRPGGVPGPIFPHHFGLGQVFTECLPGAEEDQASVGNVLIFDKFGVRQKLLLAEGAEPG